MCVHMYHTWNGMLYYDNICTYVLWRTDFTLIINVLRGITAAHRGTILAGSPVSLYKTISEFFVSTSLKVPIHR